MLSFVFSALLLASAATKAAAQNTVQSPPFNLQLVSANETLDGAGLYACHEGAAIEGLCLGVAPGGTFSFNSSEYDNNTNSGYLIYNLIGGNFNLSSPLSLTYYPTSNVALPLFTPAEYGQGLQWDEDDFLGIPSYIDDTVSPPTSTTGTLVQNWAICQTYYGYTYWTLAWIVGEGEAQNPSCDSVQVKRVFLEKTAN